MRLPLTEENRVNLLAEKAFSRLLGGDLPRTVHRLTPTDGSLKAKSRACSPSKHLELFVTVYSILTRLSMPA